LFAFVRNKDQIIKKRNYQILLESIQEKVSVQISLVEAEIGGSMLEHRRVLPNEKIKDNAIIVHITNLMVTKITGKSFEDTS